ncbi:MAG: response regulator [Acidobacteria bacterium]|nr:MAG: response regulator [Acidobacteriota bacterium]
MASPRLWLYILSGENRAMLVRCPQCRMEIRLAGFDAHQRVVTYLCNRCAEIVHIDLILDEVKSTAAATSFQRIRQGRTILVADDSSALCSVAAEILRQEGHRVLLAANGDEALEQLERHHPDLLITGLMLRGVGAVELLRRLRASRRLGGARVLIMSQVAKPEMVHHLAALGADGFLDQERLVETLVFRVGQVLDDAPGPRPRMSQTA